jgi:hypothetical protein
VNLLNHLSELKEIKMNIFTKEMKTAAQGDVFMRRVNAIPSGCLVKKAEEGVYIVAHSETGHHHVIAEHPNVIMHASNDPMISYMEVIEATDASEVILEHLRNFDTHSPIMIEPGIIEIRNGREESPQGWRRVQD